jgi:arylsulfatase A-like enzyme
MMEFGIWNLRRFLAPAIFTCCAFLSPSAPAATNSTPDILLIMPDQMRGDCLSLLGHPVVRTPHLDDLAREGALFRRAYSTCPSCIPARHSLLTGLFPATSGVVGYAARPISYPTLPKLLADGGYTTDLAGRYMHQLPEKEHYGYQHEVRGSVYVSDDDYDDFLRRSTPETGGIRALVAKLGVSFNGWEAKPWPLAEQFHPTVWSVGQARKLLDDASPEKPLFLTASLYHPHPPLFPPARLFDYYHGQKLPPPAHGDWVDWSVLSTNGDKNGHRVLLTGETLRATQAGYFGLIEHLDEQIAPLIQAFKERSRKAHRSWVILVTSDHGEMLGDHGFFRKCEPYEGSANIPFIIAGSPELGFKPNLRSQQPVCLEDILPTLLDLAGLKPPRLMDGLSLVPILRGAERARSSSARTEKPDSPRQAIGSPPVPAIRDWLHSEHAPCYSKEQAFHALTDGHFKFIWRPANGAEQLFNLDQDSREEHDLARDASSRATLEGCRARLVKLLAGRPEGFSDGARLISGRPYPALQARRGSE